MYAWGIGGLDPITLTPNAKDAQSDGWTRYNFTGYEGAPPYGEYKALIDDDGRDRRRPAHGCGRALWENNGDNGQYGTTMALMLLPHWTDGCIASMEGLFFEASRHHAVPLPHRGGDVSSNSSNPVRELRYDNNDDAKSACRTCRRSACKYLMVFTEEAKAQADEQPELTHRRPGGPWNIYQVADSDLVVPLTVQPVVVNHRGGDQRERNLELGTSWFQHRDEWAAMPADDGPADWQRIDVARRRDAQRRPDAGRVGPQGRHRRSRPSRSSPSPCPRSRSATSQLGDQDLQLRRRQGRRAGARQDQLLPELAGRRRRGSVPHRPEPDGGRADVERRAPARTSARRSTTSPTLLTFIGIGMLIVLRIRGDVRHRQHPSVRQRSADAARVRRGTTGERRRTSRSDDPTPAATTGDPTSTIRWSPIDDAELARLGAAGHRTSPADDATRLDR